MLTIGFALLCALFAGVRMLRARLCLCIHWCCLPAADVMLVLWCYDCCGRGCVNLCAVRAALSVRVRVRVLVQLSQTASCLLLLRYASADDADIATTAGNVSIAVASRRVRLVLHAHGSARTRMFYVCIVVLHSSQHGLTRLPALIQQACEQTRVLRVHARALTCARKAH